jgi:hypothetical protein
MQGRVYLPATRPPCEQGKARHAGRVREVRQACSRPVVRKMSPEKWRCKRKKSVFILAIFILVMGFTATVQAQNKNACSNERKHQV